jgi:glycosyltransferase involved in cell wall biosynthesis
LPTYNRAYVLWRAVESILAQTEPRWVLLIIDDGSTDDTPRLLEEFHDPRICLLKTNHHGVSAARNFGASHADSPYIAYLDSDNTWHPEFLAAMLQAINRNPNGVLWYCGQHTVFWNRNKDGQWILERECIDARGQYGLADIFELNGADANCMVHTRALLEEIGGWDEGCSFLEDWDLFARSKIRYQNQVFWVPEVLAEYRQVYGVDVDGLCAMTVQDPVRNQAQWKYLIDKWISHPGFADTAKRLTNQYLQTKKELD